MPFNLLPSKKERAQEREREIRKDTEIHLDTDTDTTCEAMYALRYDAPHCGATRLDSRFTFSICFVVTFIFELFI